MCLILRAREVPVDPPNAASNVSSDVGGCCLDQEIDLDQGGLDGARADDPGPQLAMETR